MTDRELLELAARAAGYTLIEHYAGLPLIAAELNAAWNPLADDGDALRLAVKCGIDLICFNNGFEPRACAMRPEDRQPDEGFVEPHGADPYAATRRAIVRAAAEIGKGMT